MPPPSLPPSTPPARGRSSTSHSSQSRHERSSSTFSGSTRLEIQALAGDCCWACSSVPVEICRVIPREDTQVPVWADAGLLTFPIDSVKNGIALCPSCHAHFDKIIDPGFAFIPTDLDFCINFEIQDRERRRQMQGARRRVPDSEAYRLHQTDNGTIPVDAPGGYYTPIFLQNYFHGGILSTSLLPLLSTPKAWHGEPLAALRRCFLLLGSLRSRSISADTRRKLVRLRDLYFYDDDDNGDGDDGGCPSQRPDRGATNNEKKRNKDSPTPSAPPPSPKRARPSEGKGGQFEYCPVSQRNQWLAWNLGPDVTTNEVVRRYAPLIARSDR